MQIPFPTSPYSNLRDPRPKRIMSPQRLFEVVEKASHLRTRVADVNKPVCMLDMIQRNLPQGVFCMPDDEAFRSDGSLFANIPAFCDFNGGIILYLREYVWDDLFKKKANCARRQNANEVIGHEFGHIFLKSHQRKLSARARKSGFTTSKRAAKDTSVSTEIKHAIRHRNLDLEEEADFFGIALQVPVTHLDGSLSVEQIAETYAVSHKVAYLAAMLAKDYHRAKAIIQQKK